MTTPHLRKSIGRSPLRLAFLLIPLAVAFACFALSPVARAVCREGCDLTNGDSFLGQDALPNDFNGSLNTAIGLDALFNVDGGVQNTALGAYALYSDTTGTGSFNTALGAYALYSDTTGGTNVAVGYQALYSNTTAGTNVAIGTYTLSFNTTGTDNTATGTGAMVYNTTGTDNTANGYVALNGNTGSFNTATGAWALYRNTSGNDNTATGYYSLNANTTGGNNTATGLSALQRNTIGASNTSDGASALFNNTTGNNNTAVGFDALLNNTTGIKNTATGVNALSSNTTGGNNIALGQSAGANLTTGNGNIDIGNAGIAGEAKTIRIGATGTHTNAFVAGINGVTVAGGVGVIVDSTGHLGTIVSSQRFKTAIKPMEGASESILALKPVTFRYKPELDPEGIPQFGLVAEDVEKVNPDLVARDDKGKVYTVRYEAINAMLLNEFLKEHRKVEQQEAAIGRLKQDFGANIAQQAKQIEALTATVKEQAVQMQKVSAQLEFNKTAPRVVNNP